jgi:phosphoribosylformylglycinamidine cyclo-ligase
LPSGVGAEIQRGTWAEPPIFKLIQDMGQVDSREMFHAFNMGLGMLVIVPAHQVSAAQTLLPELRHVGEIVAGEARVELLKL